MAVFLFCFTKITFCVMWNSIARSRTVIVPSLRRTAFFLCSMDSSICGHYTEVQPYIFTLIFCCFTLPSQTHTEILGQIWTLTIWYFVGTKLSICSFLWASDFQIRFRDERTECCYFVFVHLFVCFEINRTSNEHHKPNGWTVNSMQKL